MCNNLTDLFSARYRLILENLADAQLIRILPAVKENYYSKLSLQEDTRRTSH
jgi:hypothetical protein